jgi:hypothetical protein
MDKKPWDSSLRICLLDCSSKSRHARLHRSWEWQGHRERCVQRERVASDFFLSVHISKVVVRGIVLPPSMALLPALPACTPGRPDLTPAMGRGRCCSRRASSPAQASWPGCGWPRSHSHRQSLPASSMDTQTRTGH